MRLDDLFDICMLMILLVIVICRPNAMLSVVACLFGMVIGRLIIDNT